MSRHIYNQVIISIFFCLSYTPVFALSLNPFSSKPPTAPAAQKVARAAQQEVYTTPDGVHTICTNTNLNMNISLNQSQNATNTNNSSPYIPPIDWQGIKSSSYSFIATYYRWLITATCIGAYSYLYYSIRNAQSYLNQPDMWFNWHETLSLEKLLSINTEELEQELLLDIQRRYTNLHEPTNFIAPLISFAHAIDQEFARLSYYKKLYKLLSVSYVYKILPISIVFYQKTQRLTYLKNIFLTWAAHYRVEHNKSFKIWGLEEEEEEEEEEETI